VTAAVTSYIVTAIDESTGASAGATGSASPITISPGGGTFKIRAQAVNGFGPGRLTEFEHGECCFFWGGVVCLGDNTAGQIGDGTTDGTIQPCPSWRSNNWSQVSDVVFSRHALKTTAHCGLGARVVLAALGMVLLFQRPALFKSERLRRGIRSAAGGNHSGAIKTDGTLWMWGEIAVLMGSRALGDGTVIDKSSPIQVGSLTNWAQVAVGESTQCGR
jgi:hypothetical protein